MYTPAPAKPHELSACIDIIREGRMFQQEQGFVQWTEEYPNPALLEADIKSGSGYLMKIDGEPAAYMFLSFEDDPAYLPPECAWRADVPYVAVHRIAFARRFAGKGLSGAAFDLIRGLCREKGISCIRIDTDKKNQRMQHVLEKNGFVRCGYVLFEGDKKLAYDNLF